MPVWVSQSARDAYWSWLPTRRLGSWPESLAAPSTSPSSSTTYTKIFHHNVYEQEVVSSNAGNILCENTIFKEEKKQRKYQGINSWIDPALTDSISGLFFYERKRRDTSFNKILCKLENSSILNRIINMTSSKAAIIIKYFQFYNVKESLWIPICVYVFYWWQNSNPQSFPIHFSFNVLFWSISKQDKSSNRYRTCAKTKKSIADSHNNNML